MAYLTRAQAIAAARRAVRSANLAEAELRKTAQMPRTQRFDVFLSHSIADAEVVFGVMQLLESDGLSVYVDWIIDPRLDRRAVTPATAAVLRDRMNHCGFLLYASSTVSSNSKWMPWELGYFDGLRGQVGILPVVDAPSASFAGVEYLGLYPRVELVDLAGGRSRFGIHTSDRTRANTIATLARK
jgi:hypothetical protein